jgi:preprotein translocase subunit SecG
LIQNSKGGGLTSEFGGSGANQMFGVQKTTDLLERITWGLAGAMAVLALVSHLVIGDPQAEGGAIRSVNAEKAQSKSLPAAPAAAPTPAPATPQPAAPVKK